jgi:DNA primase
MAYNPNALKKLIDKEKVIMLLESLGAHSVDGRDSNGIRSSCPIHHSNGGTVFTYNLDKHAYICYGECSEDEKAGDLINLVQYSQKCSYSTAVEYISEVCDIDIKLLEDNAEFMLEELKIKLDLILEEIYPKDSSEEDTELYYGVKPIDENLLQKMIGLKDDSGFIDSQGFKESTLELFESCYDSKDQRWLLPQRSPDGILLGFDGRDITNKNKVKWKKRKGLLKNKLLGRLDIVGEEIITENKIILSEGKKDMMAIYEAGLKHATCAYGSTLSIEQKEIIDTLIDDEIIIFVDGDKAGYKYAQSVVKLCYPEYKITAIEIEDSYDPADLSKKHLLELYQNRIDIELWLKMYEYRTKLKK